MTRKEYLKPALVAFIGLGMILFCLCNACNDINNYPVNNKEKIIAEYQKKLLQAQRDTLTIREYIYLDRWHESKVITKTKFETIYKLSPDTCHTYIKELQNAVEIEQKAAQMVRTTDSLIIVGLDEVIKIDSLLLVKQKQDYQTLVDSIPKIKRKSKWQGAKIGAAVLGTIELIGGVILLTKP